MLRNHRIQELASDRYPGHIIDVLPPTIDLFSQFNGGQLPDLMPRRSLTDHRQTFDAEFVLEIVVFELLGCLQTRSSE